MARKHQSKIGHKIGILVLSVLTSGSLARGQDNAPAPMPAPFSQDCQIGGTSIVEESPLPNVAAALQSRKRVKILAIGASSQVGRRYRYGWHSEQIEQILEQAIKGLDVVMLNRGVSGELAAQAAARIKNLVALDEPDLVLWQVGTNDALAYVSLAELETTIVDTIEWLKAHKVDVVLAGLQYVDRMAQDAHYAAVRELLRKVAAKENVMIVRRYEAQRLLAQAEGSGGGLAPDEFQRNEAGYACLSQYMARAITLGIFGKALRVRPIENPPAPPQK
jgi:lysophospholipase L1-like esterase